jgi:phasin family protein
MHYRHAAKGPPQSPRRRQGLMAKTTTTENRFFDVSKAFGDFRFPHFDADAIVAAQRKNVEALMQANQLAVEGVRAIAERQAEIMQQTLGQASSLLREWTQPDAPIEKLAKNVEVARQAFENTVANVRELNHIRAKASEDVFNVIARRVSHGLDEVRLYAKKQAAAE